MSFEEEHTIELEEGISFELNQPLFFHAGDGAEGLARTNVNLLAQDGVLEVRFTCLDDPYWKSNTYTEHNTDLWRQEVFEVFIASGDQVPARYLELEINPNNAFFAAWVENYSAQRPEKLSMLTHDEHGIIHEIETGSDSWAGKMQIPLTLLGDEKSKTYRLNFYRIVLREQPTHENWECGTDNCDFLCWNPTMSGEQPAFHRPKHFGSLVIRG